MLDPGAAHGFVEYGSDFFAAPSEGQVYLSEIKILSSPSRLRRWIDIKFRVVVTAVFVLYGTLKLPLGDVRRYLEQNLP